MAAEVSTEQPRAETASEGVLGLSARSGTESERKDRFPRGATRKKSQLRNTQDEYVGIRKMVASCLCRVQACRGFV